MKILPLLLSLPFASLLAAVGAPAPDNISAASYPSIQEAIDKNPGQPIFVPSGTYIVSEAILIHADNTSLHGPGGIVQTNAAASIIKVDKAANVSLSGLTVTRSAGSHDTMQTGIEASDAPGLTMDSVHVIDNCTRFTAVLLTRCDHSRILNCLIQDYMRITEEDRRPKKGWGFAFMTLGGTGVDIRSSNGVLFQGNRIIETEYVPTEEIKKQYGLGKFTHKDAVKGVNVDQKMWDSGYNNAWHQGAALHLGGSDYLQILGNYIENAAQGIDVQSDHVIVANNIVNTAFVGMKTVHGARNVIITGNQFSKNDLWGIAIAPGANSRIAGAIGPDGKPSEANVDGDTIVANNIFSDFGYGPANWMWKDSRRYVIRFDESQPTFPWTPPLKEVIVEGNIVYDTGRDGILVDGKPQVIPPRYDLAVYVSQLPGGPQNIRFSNNIFNPGKDAISNVDLTTRPVASPTP